MIEDVLFQFQVNELSFFCFCHVKRNCNCVADALAKKKKPNSAFCLMFLSYVQ